MRRTVTIALMIAVLCLMSTPTSAQESGAVLGRIQVLLKTNTVQIRVLETTTVEVRLRGADGKLRAWTERLLPATGIQDVALYTASGSPAIIRPGDRVVVTPEGEAPAVVTTAYLDGRPPVGADTLSLEGPPNTTLGVEVNLPDETFPRYFEATTDDEGLATLEFASIDLRPGTRGRVFYEPVTDHFVAVSFQPPTVVAQVGGDWIEGIAWAEREVALTLEGEAGEPVATTRLLTDGKGYFSTHLAEGFSGLRILAGQMLRVTWEDQAIAVPVPDLSIQADPETDQITGRAPAGDSVSVTVYDQASRRRRWYDVTADQDGRYQLNLAGQIDLSPLDDGSVIHETSAGHQAVAEFRVPFVELEVGSHRVTGRGLENAGIIVTLEAGDGSTKASAGTTADTRGNFAVELTAGGQPVPVTAADTLHVTVGEEPITLHVPELSVQLHPDEERVSGVGPPGESLEVSLAAGDDQLTREVIPTTDGTYSFDVGDQIDVRAGTLGTATYTTPGEHQVTARDRLTQVTVQAGANYVAGTADADAPVDVFVRDAAGQLKDRAQTTADGRGRYTTEPAADCRTPVAIEAGDEVTVRAGTEEASLIVPSLTAQLDPDADRVTGTGPAGAVVEIRLSAADGSRRDEITVGDDGRYSVAYAPDTDVQPDDHVTVSFVNPAGHATFVRANAPAFSAAIGDAVLRGSIAPLETVRVTLRDDQDTSKAEATATSSRSGSFALVFRDDADQPVAIEAGDHLEIERADTTHLLEVPPLTLTLDPADPTASGTTLPDTPVSLTFVTQSRFYVGHPVTADAAGHFAATFDADIAVQAGDWVGAQVTTAQGLEVNVTWRAPQITAHVGTNYVNVEMAPSTPLTVTLRNSAGTLLATGAPDPTDEQDYFFTSDGQAAVIQPGNRIVLEQDGSGEIVAMTVPDLTADLVAEASVVQGSGPAGGQLTVSVRGTGGVDTRTATVPVWADAAYTARFAGLDLGPGASATVSYTAPETGHRAVREVNRGWFRAHIGEGTVQVRAQPLSEVTLTLRKPGGEIESETEPIRVDHHGRATVELPATGGAPAIIRAGDTLELETTAGVTALTIPEVPLGIDVRGDRVFGTVLGLGTAVVTLTTPDGCTYARQLQPAPDGDFQASFAYDADIGAGDSVTLRYTTSAGHGLQLQRFVHTALLPLISRN